MNINIPAKALKQAIALLKKVYTKKSTLPILSYVLIELGDELKLSVSNLAEFLSITIPDAKCEGTGRFLLPFDALVDASKNAGREAISIERHSEQLKIITRVDGQEISKIMDTGDLDLWPDKGLKIETKACPELNELLQAYQTASKSSSTDNTRFVINGVCIDSKEGKVVGTNGTSLMAIDLSNCGIDEDIIIPASSFLRLNHTVDGGAIGFSEDNARLMIQTKLWDYSCKLVEGSFPNYKQVIPSIKGISKIVISDQDLKLALKVIDNLPGDSVILCAYQSKLILLGQNEDSFSHIHLPDSTYASENLLYVTLDKKHLKPGLQANCTDLYIKDLYKPVAMKRPGATYVLMPLRGNDNKKEFKDYLDAQSFAKPKPKPPTKDKSKTKEPIVAQEISKTEAEPFAQLYEAIDQLTASLQDSLNQVKNLKKRVKDLEKEQKNKEKGHRETALLIQKFKKIAA
ncbi:MAG: hypothetical protein HRT89_21220 [Lentisphaeria bacterium]|nr:DNA polymerase III subunit beta [Lentisphaeria bacterium]NQZ70582.1 hypothetical protein [Lentisphaeria bacterium]